MSKLNNFRNQWQQAPVMQASEFETPEDGTYKCLILDAKYTECDKDGNDTDPTFVYIFRVEEGGFEGMKFRKFTTIKTEKNLSYLKGDLSRLGLPVPADPEELPAIHRSACGLVVEVTVKSRSYNGKTYKDCYFDKLIGRKPVQPSPVQAQPSQSYGKAPAGYQETPFNPNRYDDMPPF